MQKLKVLEIFSIPHSLEVIFACESNGNVTQITRKLGLSSTSLIYPALDKLLKYKVLQDERKYKGGLQRKFHLTEKGKDIVKKLWEINKLLVEQV